MKQIGVDFCELQNLMNIATLSFVLTVSVTGQRQSQ